MTRLLRILHAPSNVAGTAGLIAAAQREQGSDAVSVEYVPHPYAFRVDRSLGIDRRASLARKALALTPFALSAPARFDVFHFYFGHSLLPYPFVDLPLLRALRKRIVFHFCGCDVRDRNRTLAEHELSSCSECVSLACLDKRRPSVTAADVLLVSTPDLLEFVPGATLLTHPVDLDVWRPRSRATPADAAPARIVHVPSDRHIKGTRHLVAAVEHLRSDGYAVELDVVEQVPQADVVDRLERADIVVEQLMTGSYGMVAANALAIGVPVVSRIRDDLRRHYPPDLPIVSAGPGDIYEVLRSLLDDRSSWAELGRRGAEYARREHDSRKIAAQALTAYRLG